MKIVQKKSHAMYVFTILHSKQLLIVYLVQFVYKSLHDPLKQNAAYIGFEKVDKYSVL